MRSSRRELLSAGMAAFLAGKSAWLWAQADGVFSPEAFGARGDGVADDTAALQACLDRAGEGGLIRLRSGAVYRIDTNAAPTKGPQGGIKLRPHQILELNGAELKALPSSRPGGAVIQGFRSDGWHIRGPGRITGERDIHQGKGGEWGMGVSAFASSGWRIGPEVEIGNCWGDGIYVGAPRHGEFSENFRIVGVRISNCRRNGISVVAGRNGTIRSCAISDINGTLPRGGIDLEPDSRAHPNRNLKIVDCRVFGSVAVGIYITVANENIELTNVDLVARNSGVIIHGIANGIRITGSRIRSRRGGAEGAGIRAVGKPDSIQDVLIQRNDISGGGLYVVDFWGKGYRNVVVTENTIAADNEGVRGIARVHYSTFTHNDCTIAAEAGWAGAYFLHLQGTVYGGNKYRSFSQFRMRGIYRGGTEIAPELYLSPSLIKYSEPL